MAIAIPLDPRDTGLLVVDMQNGFCHPKGALGAAGLDMSTHQPIIPRIRSLVEACHAARIPVLWSKQIHYPDDITRQRRKLPSHLAKGKYLPCLRNTWDAEILDDLKAVMRPEDDVFEKHRSSCFYQTNLEVKLRMRGITTLIITGVTTNYCVEATIRDAYARDLDLLVVEDGCASSWHDLHDATMKNVAIFHGQVVSTQEVLDTLASVAAVLENRG